MVEDWVVEMLLLQVVLGEMVIKWLIWMELVDTLVDVVDMELVEEEVELDIVEVVRGNLALQLLVIMVEEHMIS